MQRFLVLVWLLFAIQAPAAAQWYEAQSDHFVIYAKDKPDDVQRFGEMLERYHSAMSFLTGRPIDKPTPSARVTIYVVGSEGKLSDLAGNKNIAGFYIPRASGSVAFVPSIDASYGDTDFSLIVLLHEYAHHFLLYSQRTPMPHWLSEGAAEFYASTKFKRDGSILIGRPAVHRGGDLFFAKDVTAEELIDHELYEKKKRSGLDAYYGKAWALVHMLHFSKTRQGQLSTYWKAIADGTPSRKAGEQAFGDLKKLETELEAYIRKRTMYEYNLTPDRLPTGPVMVRALSAGFSEAMPLVIRSRRGVDSTEAAALLPQIRAVAARHPTDAHVLTALAEAEYDAGNDAEAIAAADQAVTSDPTVKNAYVQKAYALFRRAGDAAPDKQAEAYRLAMQPLGQLNKLENDHPLPLIYLYRSYVEQGREPSAKAREALEYAAVLAPFDHGLALQVAEMQASFGELAKAKDSAGPVAANPHGGRITGRAKLLLARIEAGKEGTPVIITAVDEVVAVAESKAGSE